MPRPYAAAGCIRLRPHAHGNDPAPPALLFLMTPLGTRRDPLSELIARLHFTVTGMQSADLPQGSRASFDGGTVMFHHLGRGRATVSRDGEVATIAAGDFLLLPRGGAHTVTALDDAELFSGAMVLDSSADSAIERQLPHLLVACCFVLREPLVAALLDGMRDEQSAGRPGSAMVVTGLANVVAAAAIRTWIEQGCAANSSNWLISLRDPHIALALEAMHSAPSEPWTVAGLARVAQSSRSIFAERFRETVGDPPLKYLARLRMERAKELLGRDGLSVSQTAATLGYGSDVAFSRAFRRFAGASPTAWRDAASGAVGATAGTAGTTAAGLAPF
ncbi:AraC family transcriptional regulator [Herbiconiux daphne]|uniref:AraC family transcriptional regulator n=1 Tax=Herbiconiux daphne TaxID=2970914 RepID=A0ABT2GZ88_9MICO|nr:AraC family transcriptional regulator [Herbiconiux daphne]MCS5732370.1 AraC family transcriptional regulator [Herbiconiux daphne]